jgi:hypothetical protein
VRPTQAPPAGSQRAQLRRALLRLVLVVTLLVALAGIVHP